MKFLFTYILIKISLQKGTISVGSTRARDNH